jgi:hypothetical protein
VTGDQRDIEARLRASLHAYAEVAGDEPLRRAPVARPRRGSAVSRARGWRAPLLVAAAVLAVAGGAWLVVDQGPPSPTAASSEDATVLDGNSRAESAPEPSTDSSAEAQAGAAAVPGEELGLPTPVEVGVAYPVDLSTHCGILGADVGGVWFAADPPLVEEYGAPAGWGDPYQRGILTLESGDEAVFRDDAGHEVRLRAAESERPPICE